MEKLKSWFLKEKRSFPWREVATPYRVWVSEVMLQQTIASVVVPYFERWMERFPTIERLAEASIDEVIKMWEGLGYYSRARRLHEGARYVMTNFHGNLPSTPDLLSQIPGLGPYTVGAILNFAFHERALAIDANVTRVITRYYAIDGEIEKKMTQTRLQEALDQFLPHKEPWVISEALIELGAIFCKTKPACLKCPLIEGCQSYKEGKQHLIPLKKKREKSIPLYRIVAIIEHDGEILLRKEEKNKVLSELFEFFYIEQKEAPRSYVEALSILEKELQVELNFPRALECEVHSFTRFRAHLFPIYCHVKEKPKGVWKKKEELFSLPFSSGHRRLLHKVFS